MFAGALGSASWRLGQSTPARSHPSIRPAGGPVMTPVAGADPRGIPGSRSGARFARAFRERRPGAAIPRASLSAEHARRGGQPLSARGRSQERDLPLLVQPGIQSPPLRGATAGDGFGSFSRQLTAFGRGRRSALVVVATATRRFGADRQSAGETKVRKPASGR